MVRTAAISLFMLAIAATGFAQKTFSLPVGITEKDYAHGVVCVKLHEKYRYALEGAGAASKIRSTLNVSGVRPIAPNAAKSKSNRHGRLAKPAVDISLFYKLYFDEGRPVEEFVNELYASGYFEIVEPVYGEQQLIVPNDTRVNEQYYLSITKTFEAWDVMQGSETVVIGIVDTGGDLDHPDLKDKLYINEADPVDGVDNDNDGYVDNYRGWDFSGAQRALVNTPGFIGDNNPSITKGGRFSHGTKVAGCAAASVNNGQGIAGIGYNTRLLFTKHFSDDQGTNENMYSSNTYDGVVYAATHGAKIINCSWGSGAYSQINQEIIRYVTLDLGCLVVAAAGNSNSTVPIYPASYEYVISVAASNASDLRHSTSSFGKNVDIIAPGATILTTTFDNAYAYDQGTSLAAPLVSGAASLVWAANPSFTALQVAEQVRASADENFYLNNSAYRYQLGKGRLDVFKAVTAEIPSIRVANARLLTDEGNPAGPGESCSLYVDFINFLRPSSPALTASISCSSPHITFSNNAINLGTIASLDTVSNLQNRFVLSLGPNTPLHESIEAIISFDDGEYHDYQVITLPLTAHQTVNENNITTSITAIGRLGYINSPANTQGVGFLYDKQQLLSEIGLIMGTSASDLHNNVRAMGSVNDQDFMATTAIRKITPGERSSSEVYGTFRNAAVQGTESLLISYRSLVWDKEQSSPYNDFVILEYKIKNTTAADVSNFYFGIFADWDIGLSGWTDYAAWHSDTRLGYVAATADTVSPYAGIQLLKGNANYRAIDNNPGVTGNPFGLYDGYSDEEKFASIASGFTRVQTADMINGADISHVVSSGPHMLPAGSEIVLSFALHAAPTLEKLVTSARYADSLYNFTLSAPTPAVSLSETCYGDPATLAPQGASTFKWYHHFTGGEPVAVGSQFITSPLVKDTMYYVSNAEFGYESLRVPMHVKVNPKPTAAFSYSGDMREGAPISFKDESEGAATWLWNFEGGGKSTEQDPSHVFTIGGNSSVSLTVTNESGCSHSVTHSFMVTGTSIVDVYPNPATETLMLRFLDVDRYQQARVTIHDSHGRTIQQLSPALINQIDLSALPGGIYLVKVHAGAETETIKIMRRR